MRITKVYTRGGDGGQTSLVGGRRVSKSSTRVAAYGEIDELNSVIGLARSELSDSDLDQVLKELQNELFTLGADLASPQELECPRIGESHVQRLEQTIEQYLKTLPPLKDFILPTGNRPAAFLHLARTVGRRAERVIVRLSEEERISALVLAYVNRLSDLFFVLARVVNQRSTSLEDQVDFGKRPGRR